MLIPIVKEEGITQSERYLAKISEQSFMGLWSFPNIYTNEGFNKNNEGKELCDLLVVFENKIIIFSDKDIRFNEDIDIKVAWKRWFNKSVLNSCRQLYGAELWLKNHSGKLFLDKKCNKEFPLYICADSEIYLIAVTKNSTKPAENFYSKMAKGSSGTFIQSYCFSKEQCLENPFVISNFYPNKTFIHVLDEITLDLLLSRLDTIYDFTSYLKAKERAIKTGYLVHADGEEELLAYYFSNINKKTLIGDIPKPIGKYEDYSIHIQEGHWAEFENSYENMELLNYKNKSKYWDELISIFTRHILNATVAFGSELSFHIHETAVKYMASENRISRGVLGEAFEEKFKTTPGNARSARLIFSPLYKNRLYIFLFFPCGENITDDEYRSERREYMECYALAAKYMYANVNHVVVLATETKKSYRISEDLWIFDFEGLLSHDQEVLAKKIIEKFNILKYVKNKNIRNISKQKKPYVNMIPDIGRNDFCLCGSGKKYKKCCLNYISDI